MFRLVLVGLLLLSMSTSARTETASQEYVVTVVKGRVVADGNAVGFMEQLKPTRTIELGTDAQLVLFRFRGAKEYTLTGPGSFVMRADGVVRTSATGALQQRAMDPAFSRAAPGASLVQAGVTLRAGGAPSRDTPHNGENVAPGAPTFRWNERPRTGDYEFLLADDRDRVLAVARPAGEELTLPAVRLAPGAAYRWELRWRDPAGQMRMAMYRFDTLSADDAATLERLRPQMDTSGSASILFGLWLRSVGARSLADSYLAP